MSDVTNGSGAYAELRRELRESELLGSVLSLLSWDQETMMPPAGTPLRAEQSGLLSQLIHERRTSPRMGELIDIGVAQGLIEKSGSWYSYGGERIGQGKENARNFLQQHPDIADAIDAKLREKLLPVRRGESLKDEVV